MTFHGDVPQAHVIIDYTIYLTYLFIYLTSPPLDCQLQEGRDLSLLFIAVSAMPKTELGTW